MTPRPQPAAKDRRPYYLGGAVALIAILTVSWFWDDLRQWLARTPATALHGSWVFDQERARELLTRAYGDDQQLAAMGKHYGSMRLTFAPGTCTFDAGDGKAAPIPCAIRDYPPDAFVVTTGEGKQQHEYVFQLVADQAGRHLLLNTQGVMAPFKPTE